MSTESNVRITYSKEYLKAVGNMLGASVECPTEIASYQCLLSNRTCQKSHVVKGSDRPPGLIQNNILKVEMEGNAVENLTASNANRLGGQWRQQPLSAASFENRGIRSSHPQHVINRDQPYGTPNGQSDINIRRGTVQNERNLAGNNLKDIRPSKSTDNPNKGLSSAEQQRLQFQREREEIELQRQKLKTSSEAGSGLKSMKFEDLQGKSNINLSSGHTTGYHDECDQLMDELASTSGIKCNSNNGNLNDSVLLIRQSQKQQEGHVTDAAVGTQPFSSGMKKTSIINILNSVVFSSVSTIKKTDVEVNPAINPPSVMSPTSHLNFSYDSSINGNNSNKINNQNCSLFLYPTQSSIEIQTSHDEKDYLLSSDYMNELVMGAEDMGGDDDYEISMRLIEQMVGDDDDDDEKVLKNKNDNSGKNNNDYNNDSNRGNYKSNLKTVDNSNPNDNNAYRNSKSIRPQENTSLTYSNTATANSFPIPSIPYGSSTSKAETVLPRPPSLIPDNYQQSLGKVTTSPRSLNVNGQLYPNVDIDAKGHGQGHGLSVNINSLFAAARAQSGDNSGIVQMSPSSSSNSVFQNSKISDPVQVRSFNSPNNKNSQIVEKYERNVSDRSSSFDILVKLGHQEDETSHSQYSPYSQNSQRMSNKLLQSPKRIVIIPQNPNLLTPDSNQRNQYGNSSSSSNGNVVGINGSRTGSGNGNGISGNIQSRTPTSANNTNGNINVSPFAFHSSSSGGGSSGGLRRNNNSNNGLSSTSSSPSPTSTSTSIDTSKNFRPLGNSNMSATSRLQLMKIQRGLTPAKKVIIEPTTHSPMKKTTSTQIAIDKNEISDIPKRNIEKLTDELKLKLAIAPNPEFVSVSTNSNEIKSTEVRNENTDVKINTSQNGIKNEKVNGIVNEKLNESMNEINDNNINTRENTSTNINKNSVGGGGTPGLQRINLMDLFKRS